MRQYHGNELPTFSAEETEYVKGSIDFIGINRYSTLYAKDCIHSSCILSGDRPIQGFVYTTIERNGVLIGDPETLTRCRRPHVRHHRSCLGSGARCRPALNSADRHYTLPVEAKASRWPLAMAGGVWGCLTRHSLPLQGKMQSRKQDVQVQELLHDDKRIEFHKAYLASLARVIK
ncbi:hypothetical protein HYC85_031028 [Camellia sinensis]|uniref:Uncharacterized protein n=1 Tax=Camellia sinensis TaxID=4442 RepID=A0A7J7FPT1_CAMSI|nr:hypothetical protein HYC85_031028 [Camellia sinensis]